MKKFLFLFLIPFVITESVWADEVVEAEAEQQAEETEKSPLVLAVRRIGLELSKTDVTNAAEYANSSVQALKATSQDYIKGIFDVALEYSKDKFTWNNGLFMEYGQTTLKPYNAPETTSENADKITFSSDLSYACWTFSNLKFGPTIREAYDTEFVTNPNTKRQNILRSSAGIALFDNSVLKSLYLTGVHEYDATYYSGANNKFGAEIGWRLEYDIREGVKFSSNGYYREYFGYSYYIAEDLARELGTVFRLDTNLWGNFSMGPYVQYNLAKSRGAEHYGSNLLVGISFNYITDFNLL